MPERRHATQTRPTRVVIPGEPRTVRGVDRSLARVERLIARTLPFDEWARRHNPTEADKEMYHAIGAGLRNTRARLLELRAKLAPTEPEGSR